jgi:hypothetical protein
MSRVAQAAVVADLMHRPVGGDCARYQERAQGND